MILGLQLYGPIACGKMDLTEMLQGLKKLGIDRVEPCITLDGKMNNPSFWNMQQCSEFFSIFKFQIWNILGTFCTKDKFCISNHRN